MLVCSVTYIYPLCLLLWFSYSVYFYFRFCPAFNLPPLLLPAYFFTCLLICRFCFYLLIFYLLIDLPLRLFPGLPICLCSFCSRLQPFFRHLMQDIYYIKPLPDSSKDHTSPSSCAHCTILPAYIYARFAQQILLFFSLTKRKTHRILLHYMQNPVRN